MKRRAVVLLVVLAVVAGVSLAMLAFCDLMLAEHRGAALPLRQAQARAAVDSAVDSLRQMLDLLPADQQALGGVFDNPALFCAGPVIGEGPMGEQSRFTILAPALEENEDSEWRYGVEDESCRLNLLALVAADKLVVNGGRTALMALPNMTEEIADALLDWVDDDDEPREFGAEREDYTDPGSVPPKNGPIDAIDELLLVRGVTPELLWGSDLNHNGKLDSDEPGADSEDTSAALGWARYLTLHSSEANVQATGAARINLNQSDLTQLQQQLTASSLGPEWTNFLILARQYGIAPPISGTTTISVPDPVVPATSISLDLTQSSKYQFKSLLDVVGAEISIPDPKTGKTQRVQSPCRNDGSSLSTQLPLLFEIATTKTSTTIPGRVNLNQAPSVVLKAIPGLTDAAREQILAKRIPVATAELPVRQYEIWPLCEGIVTLQEMQTLLPFVNAGGGVFRAQVIGYYPQKGPAVRAEVVLDATTAPSRVVFWRELQHLGRGYSWQTLGLPETPH